MSEGLPVVEVRKNLSQQRRQIKPLTKNKSHNQLSKWTDRALYNAGIFKDINGTVQRISRNDNFQSHYTDDRRQLVVPQMTRSSRFIHTKQTLDKLIPPTTRATLRDDNDSVTSKDVNTENTNNTTRTWDEEGKVKPKNTMQWKEASE